MQSILDEYTYKIMHEKQALLEERIKLVLKPRPRWMPERVYKVIIKRLFEVQIQKVAS